MGQSSGTAASSAAQSRQLHAPQPIETKTLGPFGRAGKRLGGDIPSDGPPKSLQHGNKNGQAFLAKLAQSKAPSPEEHLHALLQMSNKGPVVIAAKLWESPEIQSAVKKLTTEQRSGLKNLKVESVGKKSQPKETSQVSQGSDNSISQESTHESGAPSKETTGESAASSKVSTGESAAPSEKSTSEADASKGPVDLLMKVEDLRKKNIELEGKMNLSSFKKDLIAGGVKVHRDWIDAVEAQARTYKQAVENNEMSAATQETGFYAQTLPNLVQQNSKYMDGLKSIYDKDQVKTGFQV